MKNMKEGWVVKKFEDCIDKIPKPKQLKTTDYKSEGLHPIVSQEACLISGYSDCDDFLYKVENPVIVFGDHTRVLKHIDFDFIVGADGVKILIPIEDIDSKFFYYYLTWYNIPSLGYSRHYKLLKELVIPIPPLSLQSRIVSELDGIHSIIEKKREQLKELDALAQSIFYDMFGDPIQNEKGWEVKKIKEISIVKIGPFGSLLHTSDYISGGIPLVNPVHMQDEKICPDMEFTVSSDKLNELQNYVLHTDDIIFARRGDIGRCALVCKNDDGYLCGTGSLFVRFQTEIDSVYFIKMMRTNSMIERLTSFAKGATMLNINCKIIEDFPIPLPPLSLQQSFATKIEAIEKQKELIKQSIAEVETLLASRMQFYFDA